MPNDRHPSEPGPDRSAPVTATRRPGYVCQRIRDDEEQVSEGENKREVNLRNGAKEDVGLVYGILEFLRG